MISFAIVSKAFSLLSMLLCLNIQQTRDKNSVQADTCASVGLHSILCRLFNVHSVHIPYALVADGEVLVWQKPYPVSF